MNICVFCGSGVGNNTIYADAARELGELLAFEGHTLVYGGGNIGLMGIVADAVLEKKGHVIGIIPDFLMKKEVGHTGLTQLEIVSSMHERKRRMADLADAFLVLPGGWGTLDETAEILTWKQLGLIQKPIAFLNVDGFYDSLLIQMNSMVRTGFLKDTNMEFVRVAETPEQVLSLLRP
ncbi:MAG TPA: TIGR00730 family Rossman fold protein [Cyclobacteriaceae bacterium]|nr:TIGR00730 family Rossman fold protein [Cyclobacteriaceae bacterium]HRJ80550.1 TIGR00730 family Rossman fold protein [Cyclobacteriaceae bacterium]